MNQEERTEHSIKILSASALWYAWGRIDADDSDVEGFGTEHGQEFQKLYEQVARDYKTGTRNSRMNILDAWREFVVSKRRLGLDAVLTVDDIDRNVRYERERAAK